MVQLLFFVVLIGWPLLSQKLNGTARAAAGMQPQKQERHRIPLGAAVVVDGLRQKPEYNGLRGKIVQHMPITDGQAVKYRVLLQGSSDDKVTVNMGPGPLGLTFVDGGRVTAAPANGQAAAAGVKPEWYIAEIAEVSVEGHSKDSITAAFNDARSRGGSYDAIFVRPKELAIREDNLQRAA